MRVMVLGRPRWTVATISLVVAVALVAAWSIGRAAAAPGGVVGAPDPGADTGIEVHGDWTVDIYEADGVLAASHSFENALVEGGEFFLAQLLNGAATLEDWYIEWPCDDLETRTGVCMIIEPDAILGDYFESFSHIVQVDEALERSTPGSGRSLILEGSATAPADHSVTFVKSIVCCYAEDHAATFTTRTLSSAIEVLEGQQVVIRVELSFS